MEIVSNYSNELFIHVTQRQSYSVAYVALAGHVKSLQSFNDSSPQVLLDLSLGEPFFYFHFPIRLN